MHPEPVFVNVYGAQESTPPGYVAWRAGIRQIQRVAVSPCQAGNRFLGSVKDLQIPPLPSGELRPKLGEKIARDLMLVYMRHCAKKHEKAHT